MFEDIAWVNPIQESATPMPTISLLAQDPYSNQTSEALPFRSTTYNAKYVSANPFDKGTIYFQNPNEDETSALAVYELSFPQLYGKGYRSYKLQQQRRSELTFPFPSAPPDYDSNDVTNMDAVAQHVRGLATAYNSIKEDPDPFEIYRHVINDVAEVFVNTAASQAAEVPSNVPPSCAAAGAATAAEEEDLDLTVDDARLMPFNMLYAPDDLTVSMALTQIQLLTIKSIQALFHRLKAAPQISRDLAAEVVRTTLKDVNVYLNDDHPILNKRYMCSLLGLIVCARGNVQEVLAYLHILEDFNANVSSIVPLTVPHAKDILATFSFSAVAHSPTISPVDCYQEDPVKMQIALHEGASVQCFCVNPSGQYMAAATSRGLTVFDINTGLATAEREIANMGKNYWNMVFTEDSQHIICTDFQGKHTVFPLSLAGEQEEHASEVCVPLNYREAGNVLEGLLPPYLPFGHSRSLFLFQNNEEYLVSLPDLNREKVEYFTVAAHVYEDFYGTLVSIVSDNGTMTISLERDVVTLTQSGASCYGVVPSAWPWLQLHVKWSKGIWTLSVNSTPVELRGTRYCQSKSINILSVSCISGSGHIGSLAVWTTQNDTTAINAYYAEKWQDSSVKGLFHLPFDEGEGMWVKETVAGKCFSIPETLFVWDEKVTVPYTAVAREPSVRLNPKLLYEGRVLTSAFRLYVILPSSHKGADDFVAEVERASNVIIRVYRCPRSCAENLYSITPDESDLFVFQQRFSTFSRVRLFTRRCKENELAMNGLLECSSPAETTEWVLHEMYKKVYIDSTELQRISLENTALSFSNLSTLENSLREIKASTHKLKVLSMLSLTLVHFKKLISADEERISRIANSLMASCTQLKQLFTEKMIRTAAEELEGAVTLKSLTIPYKANILANLHLDSNVKLLIRYMSKDSLYPAVSHMVANNSADLVQTAQHLLRIAHAESTSGQMDHPVTELLFWFVVSCVCALQSSNKLSDISAILCVFINFTNDNLTAVQHEMRRTVYHAGLLPLLVLVSEKCPSVVTEEVERGLTGLLRRFKHEGPAKKENITFATREAWDVYPPNKEASRMWRFWIDFSRATNVAVYKESTTLSLDVLHAKPGDKVPERSTMSAETFLKINGGTLVFFGVGENTFTTVAQYDFVSDVSWVSLFRKTVRNLLMQYSKFLCERPKSNEVGFVPLLRNGLVTDVLKKHNIDLPDRERGTSFGAQILANKDSGKEYLEQVCRNMHNSIVPSMKPAIQAILAILVHCGATVQQAEDELKLRWFSSEWGSRLQGPNRDRTRTLLMNLATWIVDSVVYDQDADAPNLRRTSSDRRYEASLNSSCSRSMSERRGSNLNLRRSTAKNAISTDSLEQVRTFLSRETSPELLERIMAERTRAAMRIEHGLSLLAELLEIDHDTEATMFKSIVHSILEVLWEFAAVDTGTHFTDCLGGCGGDLEMKVRTAFHGVLDRCGAFLLDNPPKDIPPQEVLVETPANGKATMLLLAILCHPWDAVDCEMLNAHFGQENDMLRYLEGQLNVPTCNLTLTSPGRLRREDVMNISDSNENTTKAELMGAADLASLSRIFPNDFSFVIPLIQTSRSNEGIFIQKNSSTSSLLRADEGWPLVWKDGLPRTFYFETKILNMAGKVDVGLGAGKVSSFKYVFESTGNTHATTFPSFGAGDCVGCGLVTTNRTVFFTLNGKFLYCVGDVPETVDELFPSVRFDEATGSQVCVNFGTTAFNYDFRQLHPTLALQKGPTWYRVASTAEVVLHYITSRACAVYESRKTSARHFLTNCCEVVCRNVNKVTHALMNVGVGTACNAAGMRVKQSVIFYVAESSIMVLIATMRRIVVKSTTLPEVVSDMIFDAASVLMLLPLHSIQMSTISLLPVIIPHVNEVRDKSASADLVRALFAHANKGTDTKEFIPFVPSWCECDSRSISITSTQTAQMLPGSQRSIVLGNILPRTGVVSFSVKVARRNMSKAHSLKGGYFIGVSIAGLSPLSPTSNSQSWKAVKPPIVWAMHDTTPQLPHATNPTVKPNNFQRTYGNADTIRVVVNRDTHSIDFYREDDFLKTLFNDIPADIDLVPFVQLYNDDAAAIISAGEITAPITAPTLLSAASVDVLRSMLTLEPFQNLVANDICHELQTERHPKVTLALFNSVPDPRVLQLRNASGEVQFITVSRIYDMRCKFSIGDEANYEHTYNLRTPAKAKITCSFDARLSAASQQGLSLCVEKLVQAARRLVMPLITSDALSQRELGERQRIVDEEKDHWDFLFHGIRVGSYMVVLKEGEEITQPPSVLPVPVDYTFSAALSHPEISLSPQYCGRLATVPSKSKNAATPFIAIAEPSVPLKGTVSIRCQLIRGHSGQILGGGYYFGVCSKSFNWKRRELNSATPEVWALHDMDDTPWRLRHLHMSANFTIAADPRCIIVSGDIIRLEINRDEGTMHAFRKPYNSNEIALGLIYDNLPACKLYPFVHLFNTDAAAVLLPSNSTLPAIRLPIQQPHFYISPSKERRYCDACASQHTDLLLLGERYKCNECGDYSLCRSCFDMCAHGHHGFTKMGGGAFAHSISPPNKITPGMEVAVPGTTCMYLRSSGCKLSEEDMNCVAESTEENAFAIWGMVHQGTGQFTVAIDTVNGEPLTTDNPVFIGIDSASEVMSLSREKLHAKCFTTAPHFITYCSDPNLRSKLEDESRYPHGFKSGSRVTFDVDVERKVVTIYRDWIAVGTRALELKPGANSKSTPICCFVAFGKKNIRATILPDRNPTVTAKVEECVSSRIVKLSMSDGTVRFVTTEMCRLPLHPCTTLEQGRLGYTFVQKQMVQVKANVVENNLYLTASDDEDKTSGKLSPLYTFLIDDYNAIPVERQLHKDTSNRGASLEEGFVITRLLLILSCLCENNTFSSLVMRFSAELLDMIKGLSSVCISNEAPLDFLAEIRHSVALTADCMRCATEETERLTSFVPTLSVDERRRKYKPDMLVCCINRAEDAGVYRILNRKGEILRLQNIHTNEKVQMSFSRVLPVKQCDGQPWYTLPNGMPCSLLEHTVRVTDATQPRVNLTVEGQWEGEVEMFKGVSGYCELSLTTPHSGAAKLVSTKTTTRFRVIFDHWRYERRVRLYFLTEVTEVTKKFVDMLRESRYEAEHIDADVVKDLEANYVFYVDAELDVEGFRMNGTYHPRNGKVGTFWTISTRRISLTTASTDLLHIEPLPSCQEALIPPAPQYSVTAIMHRLIVLLARHLYLVICNQTRTVSKELIETVSLFATHPLNDRLVNNYVEESQLFSMVMESSQMVLDPSIKPWDAATLSQLITKSFLLRHEVSARSPESLLWDAMHAVVVAAHKCGRVYRSEIIRNITTFVEKQRNVDFNIYIQLFSTLFMYVKNNIPPTTLFTQASKDISAGIDLILTVKGSLEDSVPTIPLHPLHCLIDLWESFRDEKPLPRIVDMVKSMEVRNEPEVEAQCTFGEFEDGVLKVGKIMSSVTAGQTGKYYYEVHLPDRLGIPFAVGWGTIQHGDVPSQHVGSDRASFSFSGSEVSNKDFKEEYKIPVDLAPLCVIGCLLDMDTKEVCWSINGVPGAFIPIPLTTPQPLYAFVSIGTSNGMQIHLRAEEFEYAPDNYTDLSGRHTRVLMDAYDANERSTLPVKSLRFYSQLASYLSDLEEYEVVKNEKDRAGASISSSLATYISMEPSTIYLPHYPALQDVTEFLVDYTNVIAVVESCMATATRFIDLGGSSVVGSLSQAFMHLKSLVRRSFRQKLLVNIPHVEVVTSPPVTISIHITELFSTLPRTPEVALSHSVLAQLYKQIGSFSETQWMFTPLFKVNLYVSGSSHTPIDMGGPYRQLWTFLSDEIMRHPDKCYPHSDFHRNPLFVFVNNSQRISLVPDNLAVTPYELTLFNFFGKIMGHAACARTPLNIDFSPYVWKFLIDDLLTITDYYQHVDSVVEKSMLDENFLLSGVAEEIIPGFAAQMMTVEEEEEEENEVDTKRAVERRRVVAERCLVHSMDEQLSAMRNGLWSVIPRRVVRCSSWHDLEKLVCGDKNLSMEDMRKYVQTMLQPNREKFFWQIVEGMTEEQRASLLCFACGQRRLPLIRPITITENTEEVDHLPRAQSCSSLVTVPPFTTLETFRDKLLLALQHVMEMELA